MLIKINNQNPQKRNIQQVVEALKKGKIIAYPTDTYFAIGCNIMDKKAIRKIYQLKQRSIKIPFTFMCSDLKNISKYATVSNPCYKILKKLFPGPYTIILPGTKLVPEIMLTNRKTAGIRIPNHNICIQIIEELGVPLLTTTAKTNDNQVLLDAYSVKEYFGSQLEYIIDSGENPPNKPSTVLSLLEDEIEVIREGLGSLDIL